MQSEKCWWGEWQGKEHKQMKKEEIEEGLRQGVQHKLLKVENIDGKDRFSLTSKGEKEALKLLKNKKSARMELFKFIYGFNLQKGLSSEKAIREAADFLRQFNPEIEQEIIETFAQSE